ncbi:MAG: hypothetical protein AAF458_00465 [Pseudomonadota bacterium]
MINWTRLIGAALLGLAGLAAHASNNIDLSTAPERAAVQLTIYNSEDLTLVRERRVMSFTRGDNQLQFSWANTLIDPTSVEIRFPRQGSQVSLVDTTFSHQRKDVLVWNINSEIAGEVETEISYFTSGLTWSADYTLIANQAETAADLDGFIRVHNNSGERYEDAQVRVVVGQINLVEKIAALARVPVKQVPKLEERQVGRLRKEALRGSIMSMMSNVDANEAPAAPKEVIKEGLSEYFIYTVEGTETIPNGWSKRLRSFDANNVPLKLHYRLRPREYGKDLVRLYSLANDEPSGLGTTPLPNGKLMVFRRDSRDGLDVVARKSIKYVPVGDKLDVNLGPDPDVVLEQAVLAVKHEDLWLKLSRANTFKRVGDGTLVVDRNARIAGWNERLTVRHRIKNFTSKPIRVEMRFARGGDITVVSELAASQHDFRTMQVEADVAAGGVEDLLYEFIVRKGRNKKQERLEIVRGRVAPPVY